MKKFLLIPLLFLGLGCSDKGNAPGSGGSIGAEVLYLTGPVEGTSSSALSKINASATTGISLNTSMCSGCGTGNLANVFSLSSIFTLQGKLADNNACMMAVMIGADAIPGLADDEVKYISAPGATMKVRLHAENKTVTSFDIYTCMNGTQLQYVGGETSGGTGTFKFRSNGGGSDLFIAMDSTGDVSGSTWTSKTVTSGMYSQNSGTYAYFEMSQGADYLDISGVIDSGTLGTLDTNDNRLVTRTQLLGSSLQTYALGDGSIKSAMGNGSESVSNWNGDTKAEGSGPTTYDSYVTAATLPSVPTTRKTAFEQDEEWDCQMTDPIDMMSLAASNSALMDGMTICTEMFE